jgi:hypothetical protein
MKMAGAALLLTAIATPVFAQDAVIGPGGRYGLEPVPGVTYYQGYGYADEYDGPVVVTPRYWHDQYGYGFGYRNRSRVGGYSPSVNPPAN